MLAMLQTVVMLSIPRTRIFFSGRCFALATLSSMEDHMSFLASALFGLSWSLEVVYVEVLLLDAMLALNPIWGGARRGEVARPSFHLISSQF